MVMPHAQRSVRRQAAWIQGDPKTNEATPARNQVALAKTTGEVAMPTWG